MSPSRKSKTFCPTLACPKVLVKISQIQVLSVKRLGKKRGKASAKELEMVIQDLMRSSDHNHLSHPAESENHDGKGIG